MAQIVDDSSGISAPPAASYDTAPQVTRAGSATIYDVNESLRPEAAPAPTPEPAPADMQQQLATLQAMLSQQQQQPDQPPAPQQQPPLPELDDEGKAFWNQFQRYTGFDRESFTQAAQMLGQLPTLQQFVSQQQQQQAVSTLKQEWGNNFDSLMPEVTERFKALPPQMQQALDNVDGARLLAAQIMQERGVGQAQVPRVPVPRFDRPATPQSSSRAQDMSFTTEQIQSMSESDYRKYQNAIMYAYQNGLVR